MCTSAMYGSVQCNAYTCTYIHVLKVQCVRTCTSAMYSSVQCDAYTHTYMY